MKSLNDQQFFDLAMKVLTNQATAAERAELDSAVAHDADLKAELERLREESQILKEALPLVNATHTEPGEIPGYARSRLQAKVRETLGGKSEAETRDSKTPHWGWRGWLLGVATATALVTVLLIPVFTNTSGPVVEIAMLDLAGMTRSTNAPDIETLRQTWKEAPIESFSSTSALEQWEKTWPNNRRKSVVKVIYDRSAAEIRVIGRLNGKQIDRTFPVEPDLPATVQRASTFISEQQKER